MRGEGQYWGSCCDALLGQVRSGYQALKGRKKRGMCSSGVEQCREDVIDGCAWKPAPWNCWWPVGGRALTG
jgi:hypothetical protein